MPKEKGTNMKTGANSELRLSKFKKGLWISWLSLIVLPVGVSFAAIGICGGPNNTSDAFALLTVGACGIGVAAYAAFRVIRGIRFGGPLLRIFGMISLCSSIVVGVVSSIYALVAVAALRVFLNLDH
jgi:hypothetical protein